MKIFLSAINIFIGIRNCSIQITGVEIRRINDNISIGESDEKCPWIMLLVRTGVFKMPIDIIFRKS